MAGSKRKWLFVVLPILVFALVLSACADGSEDGELGDEGVLEPGAVEQTDEFGDETGEFAGEEQEQPLAAETPTVEPIDQVTEEPTEGPEVQFGQPEAQWVLSEDLMGMPVYDQSGVEIADVSYVLADEQGAIQYVVFDATGYLEAEEEMNVAVPWGSLMVQTLIDEGLVEDTAEDAGLAGEDDAAATDETGVEDDAEATVTAEAGAEGDAATDEAGVGEDTAAEVNIVAAEDEDLVLVYSGDAALLQSELTVDTALFDGDSLFVDWTEFEAGAAAMADAAEDTVTEGEEAAEDTAEVTETPEGEAVEETEGAAAAEGEAAVPAEGNRLIVVDRLAGYNLLNQDGEDLGEISQMIVDLQQGLIAYAVADFGGFLGIGETNVAIPFDQLQFDVEQEAVILNVDQATLEQAPTLDLGSFPAAEFGAEDVDMYWQGAGTLETTP